MDHRHDTSRDLIMGLLALQNGLVDQDVLVLAFRAWTRDKSRPIAEILAAGGAIDADERALLEGLAGKHLGRHGNDPERSLAALGPPLSLRAGLAKIGDPGIEATLGRIESARASTQNDGDPDRTGSYGVGSATSDGQRFRILRPHARGGLGAVFVALDAELNREVALKQILDHHADDPTSRTRFVLEAEITGGLEHPGIVPVYGLGSYGDGRPYYAMRFVRGESLKEKIAAFHAGETLKRDPGRSASGGLELRKLLRRFVDVCNAVDYAHTRGVVHRDIKPANVIVGKHGETLVVDWGLAKPLGKPEPGRASDERTLVPSSSSGSTDTLPGSALGTPAYMSPEQAAGDLDRLGPRSDVYSLGATLYCLLTGKPPFEGDDLGAVVRAVGKGDFPAPRKVDPSIDRALEAVCLKAMAVVAEERYATARALADDIERWAADEPVTAWREPITRRARRWARRNRTAVSVAAASVLMAVAGLTAVVAVQNQANAALTNANTRLERSNRREVKANSDLKAANERVRSRFALAEEAIRTFHTGISEDVLLKQKEFSALRSSLLRGARTFYQKLEHLLKGEADRDSRMSLALTYSDVASLTQEIDSLSDAITVYRRAAVMLEGLAREYPSDTEIRRELGWSYFRLGGHLTIEDGGIIEGLADLERARDIFESLTVTRPSDREVQADLARIESYLSDQYLSQQHFGPALEVSTRACQRWESLFQADPGWERARFGLAMALDSHGLLLKRLERFDEALAPLVKARRLAEELVGEFPTERTYGHELIRTLANLGITLSVVRRFDEASAVLERAREVIRTMTEANPNLLDSQAELSSIEEFAADILIRTDRNEAAIPVLERARLAQERLLNLNPNEVRRQYGLAMILRAQAQCYRVLGRPTQARPLAERAQSIVERMALANPTRLDVQVWLADGYSKLGEIEEADHQPNLARGYYEKALAVRQKRAQADPSDEPALAFVADAVRRIGGTLEASGQPADAVQYYRRSVAMLEGLKKPRPLDLYDIACCHSLISGAGTQAGSGLGAEAIEAEGERAVAGIRRATLAGYRNLFWIRTGDPDLKPIRSRPDFRLLIMDMSMPVEPFGR
jgi:serine/threonine-protein kinase